MRIIPEHELAPDDNPCEDCNRIRVTPITITDAEWDEIYRGYPRWFEVLGNRLKLHPFAEYMRQLISIGERR